MSTWVKRLRDDEKLEVGDRLEDTPYGEIELKEYYFIGYDKCPKCGSKKTYHRTRVQKDPQIGNCFADSSFDGKYDTLVKKDLCLKCGHIWVGQLFVWEVVSPRENLLQRIINKGIYWSVEIFWLLPWIFVIVVVAILLTLGIILGMC